jgi:hypothetical protein
MKQFSGSLSCTRSGRSACREDLLITVSRGYKVVTGFARSGNVGAGAARAMCARET